MRKGATLMSDACPRCGGVQIKYQGKSYCLNEDDVSSLLSPGTRETTVSVSEQPIAGVARGESKSDLVSVEAILEERIRDVSKQLEGLKDPQRESELLDLMLKYLETLEKIRKGVSEK